MKLNGSPDPVFETDADRTYFLTILPVHEGAKLGPGQEDRHRQWNIGEVPGWHQVGTKLGLSRDQAEKVLLKCKKSSKIEELMDIFGWSNRTKFRNKFITPLIQEGYIQMILPEKPTSPNQKYFTTEKGKKLLKR